MSRLARVFLILGLVAAAALFALTEPQRLPNSAIAAASNGNAQRGARIFWAGGCASCHAAAGAKGDDRLKLGGGAPLKTPFGSFHAPNISPDTTHGIGGWSLADFANAMQRGVDPEGRHLYPAFPYASYQRMTKADVADLFAYLKILPPVATDAPETTLSFPFNIRRGIGLWKHAFMGDAGPMVDLPAGAPPEARTGQYLVEGPGHCGECHTARGLRGLGGLDRAHWLAGAASLDGPGKVPNITSGRTGIGSWSAKEIADYLETGFTPDYDSVGGSMVEVQANMAKLTPDDRAAIAAYLKAIPAH
ncbi:c-type cytochrome [Pseudanabaena biceps]|nr:c-type cytochrome [Pseudanabaena biceps]